MSRGGLGRSVEAVRFLVSNVLYVLVVLQLKSFRAFRLGIGLLEKSQHSHKVILSVDSRSLGQSTLCYSRRDLVGGLSDDLLRRLLHYSRSSFRWRLVRRLLVTTRDLGGNAMAGSSLLRLVSVATLSLRVRIAPSSVLVVIALVIPSRRVLASVVTISTIATTVIRGVLVGPSISPLLAHIRSAVLGLLRLGWRIRDKDGGINIERSMAFRLHSALDVFSFEFAIGASPHSCIQAFVFSTESHKQSVSNIRFYVFYLRKFVATIENIFDLIERGVSGNISENECHPLASEVGPHFFLKHIDGHKSRSLPRTLR